MTLATHRVLIVFGENENNDRNYDLKNLAKKMQVLIENGVENLMSPIGPLRQSIRATKKNGDTVEFVVDFEHEKDAQSLLNMIKADLRAAEDQDDQVDCLWIDKSFWAGFRCVSVKLQGVTFSLQKFF